MQLKNKFWVLNFGNLICCLGLSLIAPFYPTYAEQFNISQTLLGVVFAISPIGGFIASLLVGKLITNKNSTNVLTIGLLIQAVGLFQYPLLTLTDRRDLFIAISLLGRFISGFGEKTFVTPFYASIPQLYPESADQKIAIAESFSAFGYMFGPVIGSALYSLGGFSFPFLLFACCSIGIAIFIKIAFKNKEKIILIEDDQSEANINQILEGDNEENLEIVYYDLLKRFTVTSSLLVIMGLCITFTFYSPTYAIYFQEQFNVSPENVGYYMSITSLSYTIGAIILPYMGLERTIAITIGMMLVAVSQFFMGPDPLTHLNPKIYITICAQLAYGFFSAFPYIFVLPHITTYLQKEFSRMHHDKCLSLASGLFNAAIAIGEFIGPLFSGVMGDFFSFQRSSSCLGLYLLATALIFLPNLWQPKLEEDVVVAIKPQSFDEQL